MGNRTAKFISALVGSIIAGAPLAAMSQNAPTATSTVDTAADCLASPRGVAPDGQHWYYRLERSTKQKCWYLRAEGSKATRSARTAPDAKVAQDTDTASPAPQTVQNARAEYVKQQTGAAPGTANVTAPAPAAASAPTVAQQPPATDTAPQPAVATRWPDPTTASPAPAPQPAQVPVAAAPQPAQAPVAAAPPPSAKPAKSPAPAPLGAADNSTDKPTGSLPTLLLVIGGALALAGLLGSLIYRFAGARARRVKLTDRHAYWDNHATQDQDASHAPWLAAGLTDAQPPRPIDFDAARPQASRQVTKLAAIGRELDLIDARKQRAAVPAPEHDEIRSDEVEIKMFDREFEIQAATPQLVAKEIGEERNDAPAGHDQDAVDVDVVTTMLERLAKEGPRLSRANLEADLANFERSLRGRSAARA